MHQEEKNMYKSHLTISRRTSHFKKLRCKTKTNFLFYFDQVNTVDFGHFTREEAATFLLNIPSGEQVEIYTQRKMDSKCAAKQINIPSALISPNFAF